MTLDLTNLSDLVRLGALLIVALLVLGVLRFVLKAASRLIGLAFVVILVIVVLAVLRGF